MFNNKSEQHFYHPQRSWGKVMFLQVCVILFTGGEYLTRYTPGPGAPPQTRCTPQEQVHPPGPGTPQTRYTPWDQGHTVYARAVRILLECNLVCYGKSLLLRTPSPDPTVLTGVFKMGQKRCIYYIYLYINL